MARLRLEWKNICVKAIHTTVKGRKKQNSVGGVGRGESYHALNSFLATLTRSSLCALYTDRIHRNRIRTPIWQGAHTCSQ